MSTTSHSFRRCGHRRRHPPAGRRLRPVGRPRRLHLEPERPGRGLHQLERSAGVPTDECGKLSLSEIAFLKSKRDNTN